MPNKNGLYTLEEVRESKKEIYDLSNTTEESEISIDLWTYTELKKILKWELNEELRKSMIRGFLKRPRMDGFAPLYSLQEVMYLFVGYSYTRKFKD